MKTLPELLQACDRARDFEEVSDFQAACEVLSFVWPNLDSSPEIENLEIEAQTQILLRCGSIAGSLGGDFDNAQLQGHSRDLLYRGYELASEQNNEELLACFENQMTRTCNRLSEFKESMVQ